MGGYIYLRITVSILCADRSCVYVANRYRKSIMMKTVTLPKPQAIPYSYVKAFKDDYNLVEEDVLLLEGETHVLPEAVPVCSANILLNRLFLNIYCYRAT